MLGVYHAFLPSLAGLVQARVRYPAINRWAIFEPSLGGTRKCRTVCGSPGCNNAAEADKELEP